MKVKQLAEVVWQVYSDGRPKSTAQRLSKGDITQMVFLSYGQIIRQHYYESKKMDEYGEADYSFTSPILDVKEFTLSEPNHIGMRRADMSEFDLLRLPKDGHVTNMYPVGDCGGDEIGSISLVKPGEEYFYTKPEMNFFKFAVIKGKGINFYNLPICVNKVGIETTYTSIYIDVTLDIGYEISLAVINLLWKEKQFPVRVIDNSMDANALDIKHRLQNEQEGI